MDAILSPSSSLAPGRVVVLSDTQFMTGHQPDLFKTQIDHIIDARPDLVLHMGDIVDGDMGLGRGWYGANWPVVTPQYQRLTTAGIPWAVVAGNHDYATILNRDLSPMNAALSLPAWMTPYQSGHIENAWGLITLAGRQWLIMCLEFGPRTAVMAWAASVIAAHPATPVVLATHAFQFWDGTRFDWPVYGASQYGNPIEYGITPSEGCYDAEMMWQSMILPHSNIRLVLSGHTDIIQAGSRRIRLLTDTRPDGTKCQQLWLNYQVEDPLGGSWLTHVEFDEVNQRISFDGWSPFWKVPYPDTQSHISMVMP